MKETVIGFYQALRRVPVQWQAWMALLILCNLVFPIFFITSYEGQMVLLGVVLAASTQLAIYKKLGFVRFMGLAHFWWFPMMYYVYMHAGAVDIYTVKGFWLFILFFANGISLAIDVSDVFRFLTGERAPIA